MENIIEELVDKHGFSYKEAVEIMQQPNAEKLIRYVRKAYEKGEQDGTPSYNYSGGL